MERQQPSLLIISLSIYICVLVYLWLLAMFPLKAGHRINASCAQGLNETVTVETAQINVDAEELIKSFTCLDK